MVIARAIGANATSSAWSSSSPCPRTRTRNVPSTPLDVDSMTRPSAVVTVSATPGSGVPPEVTVPDTAHVSGPAGCAPAGLALKRARVMPANTAATQPERAIHSKIPGGDARRFCRRGFVMISSRFALP
jgi:hypothetical protein